MKILQKAFIAIFCAILILPLAFTNFKPDQVSAMDNARLMEFPPVDGNFPQNIQEYLKGRIGFRAQMINLSMAVQDKLFNYLDHSEYYYGQDDEIFYGKNHPAFYDFVDDQYLEMFSDHVKRIQDYCDQRGTKFLFAINPMKIAVYPEELPSGMNLSDLRMGYLENALLQKGVNSISVKDVLIENKDRMRVFNMKYDAGHWNDNGAFVFFGALLNRLKMDFPDLKQITRDDFIIENKPLPLLKESPFTINDSTEVYSPKSPKAIRDDDFSNVISETSPHPYVQHYTNLSNPDAPKILVLAGSYYPGRGKFFADSFSETTIVSNYGHIINFYYHYNIFKPDIVLYAAAQHALHESYFPYEGMRAAFLPPPFSEFEALPEKSLSVTISDNTGNAVKEYLDNCSEPLVDVGWSFAGREVSYAYLKAGGTYYDMGIFYKSLNIYDCYVSAKTEDLKNRQLDLILISAAQDCKQIIPIVN